MKKQKIKYILSWILYFVGFAIYVIFLNKVNDINEQAWIYSILSSLGAVLFCISGELRR